MTVTGREGRGKGVGQQNSKERDELREEGKNGRGADLKIKYMKPGTRL